MLDYKSLLFTPAYTIFGAEAVLTLADTAGTELTLTVIDKTSGVALGNNVEIGTLVPGAVLQVSDLTDAGLSADDLVEATIVFNGGTWRIASHYPKPVPSGEASGEIVMVLEKD